MSFSSRASRGAKIHAVLVATLFGCGHPATTNGPGSNVVESGSPVVITDEVGAVANAGKRTGVKGKAGNAKLGGMIVTDSDLTVYCVGVSEFPSEVNGKTITAFGTLAKSERYQATRSSNGEVSQGTDGPIWILEGCRYER